MKKGVWKTLGTALFAVLLGMALFTKHPGNEGDGKIPSPSPICSAAAAESTALEVPMVPCTIQPAKESPQKTKATTTEEGVVFSLLIQGHEIGVWDRVDRETLARGPGWLPSSVYPGEEGTCIIYGHRNRTHLRILEKVNKGEEIQILLPSGEKLAYIVEEIEIVNSDAELRFQAIEGQSLILTTCYPFRYSGDAPQKYVVKARNKQ